MGKILAALLLIVMGFTIAGCGGDTVDERKEQAEYRRVTADEAQVLMQQTQDYLILDVRSPEEFAEGHIPHAINIPMERFGEAPPKELPDKAQKIFVYCRSGARSQQAAQKLANMGYTNIVEMGGIKDWHGDVVK